MKKVGFWNWFGLFIGIAAIITGIVILILCLNVSSYGGTFGRWSVEYGADFYTDVAQHLRSVNNSVESIHGYVNILTDILGIAFIFGGLLVICHFGKQIAMTPKTDNDQPTDTDLQNIDETELIDNYNDSNDDSSNVSSENSVQLN